MGQDCGIDFTMGFTMDIWIYHGFYEEITGRTFGIYHALPWHDSPGRNLQRLGPTSAPAIQKICPISCFSQKSRFFSWLENGGFLKWGYPKMDGL